MNAPRIGNFHSDGLTNIGYGATIIGFQVSNKKNKEALQKRIGLSQDRGPLCAENLRNSPFNKELSNETTFISSR